MGRLKGSLFADPLAAQLFPVLATGVQWGLERTRRALTALGDPHLAYQTVHVGGTNGKGSVASTVGAVMEKTGRRTGVYTSPHLCTLRERILIGGIPIAELRLLKYADEATSAITDNGLSFFEAVTVLAFYTFARESVEIGVIEVGLGGRLDSTNVIQPQVTAITNVAMDHADYLGGTLEAIALEKAGIIKEGVPLVTAEVSPRILDIFRGRAEALGAPFFKVDQDWVRSIQVSRDCTALTLSTKCWGDLELKTPLVGHHQAINAALAAAMLEQLDDSWRPSRVDVINGISSVVHPGRDDIRVIDGCTFLFDVAHNTAGVLTLVDTIDRLELPRPLVALVGVLGDKDWRSMLPPLLSRADAAFLTRTPTAPFDRQWDPVAAADLVDAITLVRVVSDFAEALEGARRRAGHGTVVITGSAHSVGPAMTLLGLDPLAAKGTLRA